MLLLIFWIVSSLSVWAQSDAHNVVYFLEPRVGQPGRHQTVRSQPLVESEALFQLTHNQLLRFECTRDEWIDRLNRERAGVGRWLRLETEGVEGKQYGYIYDYWQSFVSVDPSLQPVHLVFADNQRHTMTVFKHPGIANWQMCLRKHDECVAWPKKSSALTLVDTRIVANRRTSGRRLYYKVQYSYVTEKGWHRGGEGWVPASAVRRVIVNPNFQQLADTGYITIEAATKMVRDAEKNTLARFNISEPELDQRFSRWLQPVDGSRSPSSEDASSRLKFKIDYDLEARAGVMDIGKSNAAYGTNKVEEEVAGVAFSGIAPIMFDLEAGGTLEYLKGVHRMGGTGPLADTIRFNQQVLYTLKSSPKDAAVKLGIGWNLQWLTPGADYDLNAVVGVHAMAEYDNAHGSAYFKLGPVERPSSISLSNYETVAGGAIRLNPELGYQSLAITGEARFMSNYSKVSGDRTDIWTVLLGLRKTF